MNTLRVVLIEWRRRTGIEPADGAFTTQDQERAGLLAKRLGLTVELAD